jgi:glycosyltransferase involved in cell wall biosynthesis
MNITIVIPTFNRADLLRIALQSVSKQTAIGKVKRIIVSENGLDRQSERICKEFSYLPIDYIFQETQLPISQHLKWILTQESHNYVALLCDDDWWDVSHLEIALRDLATHPDCKAYFSSFLYLRNEHSLKTTIYEGSEALHFGKADFLSYDSNVYTAEDISLLALMFTPFHYSSMVCAADVLQDSVEIFDRVHPTCADRLLWTVVSRKTRVIFSPLSTTLVRYHEGMDTHRYSSLEWKEATQSSCCHILKAAQDDGMEVETRLNKIFETGSVNEAAYLLDHLKRVFYDRKYLTWFAGYDKIIESDRQENSWRKKTKYNVRKLLSRVYQTI